VSPENPEPHPGFRAGYVALVGLPNAGKSTLLNRLVNLPLAIVTHRPQTTRHRILGIRNGPGFQALFLDTPGLLAPKYRLQELMLKEIEAALRDADVVVGLLDATVPERSGPVLDLVRGRRALLAVNKVDLASKDALLPLVRALARDAGANPVFLVSALKGSGVEDLFGAVVAALPESEPYFPDDAVSERSERFYVAEFIREAVFSRYGEEIPYATTVGIEEFREQEGRKDYIRATVYVERVSQRKIVIGARGAALKRVGSAARRRIEKFLGRPVFLELRVKVAEDWRRDDRFIRENVYRP
jgi:GTP-binding protein Era